MQPSENQCRGAEQELTTFVVDNFLFGCPTTLAGDDSFLEKGIIDSTGILELVAYIEERYRIKVEDRELLPDNLDSINRLAAFIRKKQQVQVCA
jgi:acyl carrier protein